MDLPELHCIWVHTQDKKVFGRLGLYYIKYIDYKAAEKSITLLTFKF